MIRGGRLAKTKENGSDKNQAQNVFHKSQSWISTSEITSCRVKCCFVSSKSATPKAWCLLYVLTSFSVANMKLNIKASYRIPSMGINDPGLAFPAINRLPYSVRNAVTGLALADFQIS